MVIIGIDPGLTGAIAVLTDGKIQTVYDMPVSPKLSGKGLEINPYLLARLISGCDLSVSFVVVERVHAMPGNGATSMFGFGDSLGVVRGVLGGLNIPVKWATPQAWKKHFGLLKKEKDAARTMVINTYPDEAELFSRKRDCGRADAVLIGLYGAEILNKLQ